MRSSILYHPLEGIPLASQVQNADRDFDVTFSGREVLMLARGLRLLAEWCVTNGEDEAIEGWKDYIVSASEKLQQQAGSKP